MRLSTNLLPEHVVQATCAKQFQCLLQRLVVDRPANGAANWHCMLSSRVALHASSAILCDPASSGDMAVSGNPSTCA